MSDSERPGAQFCSASRAHTFAAAAANALRGGTHSSGRLIRTRASSFL